MLTLTRKVGETILIGNNIRITVNAIQRGQVRLGIEAPRETLILRAELLKDSDDTSGTVEPRPS